MNVLVKVRCIYCSKTRNIGSDGVHPNGVPMCDCGGVMVAVSARRA